MTSHPPENGECESPGIEQVVEAPCDPIPADDERPRHANQFEGVDARLVDALSCDDAVDDCEDDWENEESELPEVVEGRPPYRGRCGATVTAIHAREDLAWECAAGIARENPARRLSRFPLNFGDRPHGRHAAIMGSS